MRDPTTTIRETTMYGHVYGLELARERQQALLREAQRHRRAALVSRVVRRHRRSAAPAQSRPAPRPV